MTSPPSRRLERIRKRSGEAVPYEEAKVAEAIHRAAKSVGIDNRYLAQDLAGVVSHYLEKYHEGDLPTSDEIRRLVTKILGDTGHGEIGRAFESYRAPEGPAAQPTLFPQEGVLVEGHARGEVRPWNRDRIRQALRREAGIDEAVAAEVALSVERAVFGMPYRRISTTMIRELVNQELIRRGLAGRVPGQAVIGMPKYDVARMVAAEAATPTRFPDAEALALRIGQATLQQYALQEIFSPEVAGAHMEGVLHVLDLEHPLKLHWISADVADVRRRGAGFPAPGALGGPPLIPRDVTLHLGALVRRARGVAAEAVELARVDGPYAGAADAEADYLLATLVEAGAGPSERRFVRLGIDLSHGDVTFTRSLLAALHPGHFGATRALDKGIHVGPETFRDPARAEALRDACRLALADGATFLLERGTPRWGRYAPEWDASRGLFAVAQSVALNLPQAAFRGETEPGFFAELERALELAVRAHVEKGRFLKRFASGEEQAVAADQGWSVEGRGLLRIPSFRFALALAGLGEAVRTLQGVAGDAPEAQRLAFRVLSFVYAYLKQASGTHRMELVLEDLRVDEAAARFARIDAQRFAPSQRLGTEAYSPGFALPSSSGRTLAERLLIESRFHSLVPSGTLRIHRGAWPNLAANDLFGLLVQAHAETMAAQVAVV